MMLALVFILTLMCAVVFAYFAGKAFFRMSSSEEGQFAAGWCVAAVMLVLIGWLIYLANPPLTALGILLVLIAGLFYFVGTCY